MLLKIGDYRLSEVFWLFASSVSSHCGDGIGWFVCDDPEDMAQLFLIWCVDHPGFHRVARLEKDVKAGHVNFHDSNENFIFSSSRLTVEEANREFVDCLIYLEGDPKPE